MKRHGALGEFALRPGILHAPIGGGKVMVLGEHLSAAWGAAGAPGHEPVPPRTTGIVRANT